MAKLDELLSNAVANNAIKQDKDPQIKPEEVNRVESMGLNALIDDEVKVNKK